MKILFVYSKAYQSRMVDIGNLPSYSLPSLSLIQVAAVTPADIDIEILDDAYDTLDYEQEADIVALTGGTWQIDRSYEIAREFKKRGKTVVMGGLHVSARQEEALEYADAIVIGEAEGGAWTDLVRDFRDGKLKQRYQNETYPDLTNLPPPRRDLLPDDRYETRNVLSASRGCPIGCRFCSVSRFYGPKYRYRPPEEVVAEMRSLSGRESDEGPLYFTDDNIAFNRRYSKELFREIIKAKLDQTWWGFASIDIGKNEELLSLAAESGCEVLFVGLESINQETLKKAHKGRNTVEEYQSSIANIKKHGIDVESNFIFGFDEDTTDVFQTTVDFVLENGIGVAHYAIISPYPGTLLEEDLSKEGRIIAEMPYSSYTGLNVVFEPKNLSVRELYEGLIWAYGETYSAQGIETRMKKSQGEEFDYEYNVALGEYWSKGMVESYDNYLKELDGGPWVQPF